MTQTEALKLALEAITNRDSFLKWHDLEESIKEALAQQSNEQVESVAVMELYTDGWDLVEGIDTDWLETLPFGTRLFSHPPVTTAQPEQEPDRGVAYSIIDRFLANNLNSDEDYAKYSKALDVLYTTSPQRTWVGLTDEEMRLIDPDGFEDNLPQMIQQALKEKNT